MSHMKINLIETHALRPCEQFLCRFFVVFFFSFCRDRHAEWPVFWGSLVALSATPEPAGNQSLKINSRAWNIKKQKKCTMKKNDQRNAKKRQIVKRNRMCVASRLWLIRIIYAVGICDMLKLMPFFRSYARRCVYVFLFLVDDKCDL